MTENEVLEIIDSIANRLAYKFKFGYHDIDDMKQQARFHALKTLADGKYDGQRSLENFLYTCVHNKLFNDKRDNFERPDKPCLKCPFDAWMKYEDRCTKYDAKINCELYESWLKRNFSKKNIMQPIGIDGVVGEKEDNMQIDNNALDLIMRKEIIDLINIKIPIDMRHDWIRLINGIKLPKNHRTKLEQKIFKIL